jgi:hypothetical protein
MRSWPGHIALGLLALCFSTGALALPDLVISSIHIEPSEPRVGQIIVIRATIANRGSSPVQSPFFVRFLVDGREVTLRPISDIISPGRTSEVSAEWPATIGSHVVSVEADPPVGQIDESNEKNNLATHHITVSLSPEALAAIGSLKVAVGPFEDSTGSGLLRLGEGIADALIARLTEAGIRVLPRSEMESVLRQRSLDPTVIAHAVLAGQLLGADVLIAGTANELSVLDSTFQLGFVSVKGAAVGMHLSADILDVQTMEPLGHVIAEGHDEGMTGFSLNLGGLLGLLPSGTPSMCNAGLQVEKSWFNVGEVIPMTYSNSGAPAWFGMEIVRANSSFVRWLGWQYVDTGRCGIWYWDQRDLGGSHVASAVYSARIWDGVSYVAETSFQVRPGVSLTASSVAEITVGSEPFERTVAGGALHLTMDRLVLEILTSLETISPMVREQRALTESEEFPAYVRVGQIAALLPDGRVAINIGALSGVSLGDSFDVLEAENVIIDPASLEIVGYERVRTKGGLIVNEVRDRVSFGVLTSDCAPAVGDIVGWPEH